LKWNGEEGVNVAWKTPIRGLGHSSPIIWKDRIFVTSAISGKANPELKVGLYGNITPVEDDTSHKFMVYCLNRKTGKIVWERTAYSGVPKVKRHTKATHANSTMATDGRRIVAFFGSEGLYCYDMGGRLVWKKDLGLLDSGFFMVPSAQWGFASSPIIHQGKVFIQCDVQKGSFVAALDLKNGDEIWRTPREDVPTWSTPAIIGNTLVVNGWKHIGGYDFKTGKEVWKLTGGGDIPVPTPISAHNLIYITNAHGRMSPIYAIKTTATGDISLASDSASNEHISWSHHREGAYMPTPLVYGDYLYVSRDNGLLGCYNAKTGERIYNERMGTGRTAFTASGVAADGRLYYSSEDGDIYVVKAGPKFELLATNPMGEVCMTTPAIAGDALYFRTQSHLVAIAQKK
jgi:outer membrane protein assembly factor BamB